MPFTAKHSRGYPVNYTDNKDRRTPLERLAASMPINLAKSDAAKERVALALHDAHRDMKKDSQFAYRDRLPPELELDADFGY